MAQGTGVVTPTETPASRDPRVIEREIRGHRGELSTLVGELNRRRHELTDVKLQLRRHTLGIATSVLAGGLVLAGSVAYARWRTRQYNTLAARSGRLREAMGRMIDRPERVATEPTAAQRVLASAGSALAAILIKLVIERLTDSPRRAK
ncbi:MAG TPA: hypothetical protein VFT36_04945 [Methylomirabilota bacterium]|nr:hypothetical protein [Methylomirabilota bacterium]